MDATASRSGTPTDAAICAGIGLLAVAAGLVASAAGATREGAAIVAAVVALGGLLAERLDRGGPTVDTYDLERRVGYRRQMAIRLLPIAVCGLWIIVLDAATAALGLAERDVTELLALATAVVGWSVTERVVVHRVAPRADADDDALREQLLARLRSGLPAPDRFGWRRGRQAVLAFAFAVPAVGGLALAAFGTDGGRVFGMLLALAFGWIATMAVRPFARPHAIVLDARGLDLPFQGTLPWNGLAAIGLRRQSFVMVLDVLVEDGVHDWATRSVRRRLRRKRGMTELPLLTVDADPADLVAAIRAYRPDLLVLLPGPDGAPVAL